MFFNDYDLEKMVPEDHVLRRIKERLPVEEIAWEREEWKLCLGREGYGMEAGLRALFLQFWGDYSDREMEERLRYDISYKWFCGFKMEEETPDHTFFCRVRKNMGEERISVLFAKVVQDSQMFKRVCPIGKRVLADRGYDAEHVRYTLKQKGCEDGVMRLRHRKDFDKERNKLISKRRAPWEHVFSKMSKRTRYMGLKKTYLQALMEGIVHNLKRLIRLEGPAPVLIGCS